MKRFDIGRIQGEGKWETPLPTNNFFITKDTLKDEQYDKCSNRIFPQWVKAYLLCITVLNHNQRQPIKYNCF